MCKSKHCQRDIHARGYCKSHYRLFMLGRDVDKILPSKVSPRQCSVPLCSRPSQTYDEWCRNCVARWRKYGGPIKPIVRTPTTKDTNGYLRTSKIHPLWNGQQQYEHIAIMENFLGRKLFKGETVHHKNGVRTDNRLDNLELWSTSQPYGQRVEDKITWAKEILRLYA